MRNRRSVTPALQPCERRIVPTGPTGLDFGVMPAVVPAPAPMDVPIVIDPGDQIEPIVAPPVSPIDIPLTD